MIRQIRTGVSSSAVTEEDPEVGVHTPVESLSKKVVRNTSGDFEEEEPRAPPKKKKAKKIVRKLQPSVKKKKSKSKGISILETPPSESEYTFTPYEDTYPEFSPPTTRSKSKKKGTSKDIEAALFEKWDSWNGDDD